MMRLMYDAIPCATEWVPFLIGSSGLAKIPNKEGHPFSDTRELLAVLAAVDQLYMQEEEH